MEYISSTQNKTTKGSVIWCIFWKITHRIDVLDLPLLRVFCKNEFFQSQTEGHHSIRKSSVLSKKSWINDSDFDKLSSASHNKYVRLRHIALLIKCIETKLFKSPCQVLLSPKKLGIWGSSTERVKLTIIDHQNRNQS